MGGEIRREKGQKTMKSGRERTEKAVTPQRAHVLILRRLSSGISFPITGSEVP